MLFFSTLIPAIDDSDEEDFFADKTDPSTAAAAVNAASQKPKKVCMMPCRNICVLVCVYVCVKG